MITPILNTRTMQVEGCQRANLDEFISWADEKYKSNLQRAILIRHRELWHREFEARKAPVAQLAEHAPRKAEVGSSILSGGSI